MDGEDRRADGTVGAEEEVVTETVQVGWTEALEQQFGAAPWWLVSAVLHMLVLLALGLVVVSRPPLQMTEEILTIVPTVAEPQTTEDEDIVPSETEEDITEDVKVEIETVESLEGAEQTKDEDNEIGPAESEEELLEDAVDEPETVQAPVEEHLPDDEMDETIEDTSEQDTTEE